MKPDRLFLGHNKVQIAQHKLQDLSRTKPAFHQRRDRVQSGQLGFEGGDDFLRSVRHELDDKAARVEDAAVRSDHNAERDSAWGLLGNGEIVSKVFTDLAGLQFDLSVVGLFETQVHADRQDAGADCAADIKLDRA